MNTNNLIFKDFHSYESLNKDVDMSLQLVKSYQSIFGDPELWGENYSQEAVEDKLKDELSGKAGLRLCLNNQSALIEKPMEPEILGFCWAQQLALKGVIEAIESIQFYKELGSPKILEPLKRILDEKSVLYVHDLGIPKDYRGQIPLHTLIYPVIHSLAERSQNNRLFFWSIKESRIYKLAQYVGFTQIADIAGMQFFIGNVKPCKEF